MASSGSELKSCSLPAEGLGLVCNLSNLLLSTYKTKTTVGRACQDHFETYSTYWFSSLSSKGCFLAWDWKWRRKSLPRAEKEKTSEIVFNGFPFHFSLGRCSTALASSWTTHLRLLYQESPGTFWNLFSLPLLTLLMASSLELFSLIFFDTLSWPFLPKPHHCLQSGSGHFPPLLQQLPNWSSLGWPLFHPVPHNVATVASFPDCSHEPLFSLVLDDLVVVSIATPTHLHSIWTFLPFNHLPSSSGRSHSSPYHLPPL